MYVWVMYTYIRNYYCGHSVDVLYVYIMFSCIINDVGFWLAGVHVVGECTYVHVMNVSESLK